MDYVPDLTGEIEIPDEVDDFLRVAEHRGRKIDRVQEDEKKAERDLVRHYIAELPNVAEFAHAMLHSFPEAAFGLMEARRGACAKYRNYLVVEPKFQKALARLGVVYISDPCVSLFGQKVRNRLLDVQERRRAKGK